MIGFNTHYWPKTNEVYTVRKKRTVYTIVDNAGTIPEAIITKPLSLQSIFTGYVVKDRLCVAQLNYEKNIRLGYPCKLVKAIMPAGTRYMKCADDSAIVCDKLIYIQTI